jgi:Domain of unknown function (DUF892)
MRWRALARIRTRLSTPLTSAKSLSQSTRSPAVQEANDIAGEVEDKSVLDAALIAAAQAVEHYEITRYGSLIASAKELGRNEGAALLQQNLDEEKAADKKLTAIAENPTGWWGQRAGRGSNLRTAGMRLEMLSVHTRATTPCPAPSFGIGRGDRSEEQTVSLHPCKGRSDRLMRVTIASHARFSGCG